MDPAAGSNPFSVLAYIAAPAALTNAASVMALGTSNRFARAVDRARVLTKELGADPPLADDAAQSRMKQLSYANRRASILVRSLTMFYLAVGAFAAASLTSLLGSILAVSFDSAVVRHGANLAAFGCGAVGVGGLVGGAAMLVAETRLTLAIIREEAALVSRSLGIALPHARPAPASTAVGADGRATG